ncbi:MAG: pilus assembly protein [Acidobacteria bacterium]|nr:pilus assembly protein [Acidobacteriota bacterium]
MTALIPTRSFGSRLRLRRDEGSALVEFSLISFMFIMVLFGVVELSRMVIVYTTIANASRAGARYAIVHGYYRTGAGSTGPSGPGSTTQVETVVKNFAGAGLLDTTRLTITVSYPGSGTPLNGPGQPVTVKVTYPYDAIVPFFSALFGPTMGSTSEGVIMF